MLGLQPLIDQVRQGAELDLYQGVRSLDRRFPVHQDVSDTFMMIAGRVTRLFPDRVQVTFRTSYDARIICMDFCNHPMTSRADILLVLEAD